jgi:carbon monoxide dehydrogenase subunit G
MSTLEKSIEVNVPVQTAYNQWTQFEEFPRFMEGVKEVTQLDDTHLHWKAEIASQEREWDAEITEQTPDQRIAWTSRGGAINGGVVTFHRLSDATSKVMLQLEYTLRVSSKTSEMPWERCRCACREIWSDLRNSLSSVGARQGHGGARSEVFTHTLFMTRSPNA